MDLLKNVIIIILLHIISTMSRRYASSSDESFENLLYFKDCQHKSKEETVTKVVEKQQLRAHTPPPNECPFPKMCCSLTCGGNECSNGPVPFGGRILPNHEDSFPPIGPRNVGPQRPVGPPIPSMQKMRKRKPKQPMQPPNGGRRNFGFTKDQIKNLINQDDDIRKILKDLVRVTMQKVDLVDMLSKKSVSPEPEVMRHNEHEHEHEYDDDDELE